eukprot:1692279-Pleurochrysis_carterae.AAC.1
MCDRILSSLPLLNTAEHLTFARGIVREVGVEKVCAELTDDGFVDFLPDGSASPALTIGDSPCNFFARMAAGVVVQRGMEAENALLDQVDPSGRFFLVRHLLESERDEQCWPERVSDCWAEAEALSSRHRMLTMRDLSWWWFNILVFGMRDAAQAKRAKPFTPWPDPNIAIA